MDTNLRLEPKAPEHTRAMQVARAIETICCLRPGDRVGVYVDGELFRIECRERTWGDPVWDSIVIDGHHCGNRHGGVQYLMIAFGLAEDDAFAYRHAYARRAQIGGVS